MMTDLTNEEVIQVNKGNISYLQFRKLLPYQDKLIHAISLRLGGVSQGSLSSLNFRSMGSDSFEHVRENLELFSKAVGFSPNTVYRATQCHTDHILQLSDQNKEKYRFAKRCEEEQDGYITNQKQITTLVTTADCNPIILYDTKQNIVANLHSGWKGTVSQIYLKALDQFKETFGSNMQDVIVCVGPSIGKCCFSSEEESFKEKFTAVWEQENKYLFYEENQKRFHIDLWYLIKQDLVSYGIKEENISVAGICTACHPDVCYSYRVATRQREADFGTMATITSLI